jgi:predicted lipase
LGYTTAWFGLISRISIDGYIVVAFRGTLNTADWIADANIHSTALPSFLQPSSSDIPASKILIHSGFANLYTGLRNILIAGVKGYKPKGIIITGHSLGSALATLAAYDLANQGFPVHSVYLYASPRVGNPYFAHAFDIALKKVSAKVYRISNTADIVTSIPPSALSLAGSDAPSSKYSHVGNSDCTFEYVAEDDYVLALSFGDYLKWAHSLDTYLKAFPPFSGMAQA